MASTTFIDQQTIIYAAWLNDVNNAVYNGIFAASSISPANLVCNGSVSGTGFTGLVNNTLSAPGPIGSATPNTGAFTTLTLTNKLAVAQGGTGLATLTANNVILGNGTSTPSFVAPGANLNVLTSNGTTWTSATPVLTKSFTSSNQAGPTATATAYTIAHTLGVVPKIVRLVAVCTTASGGYAVGDEIELLFSNSTNGNFQAFYYANASVIGYWSGPYIYINDASNGSLVNLINNSNFAFKVYVFA